MGVRQITNETFFKKLSSSLFTIGGGDSDDAPLAHYKHDPVGFGLEVLGHKYPPYIENVLESVRDNRVTIAISANSVGKSYAAADAALWWYLCHADSQVYTAAAPPLENLERILWGHIGERVIAHPEIVEDHDVRLASLTIRGNPIHFMAGLTIPASGTEHEREAKFSGKHAPHLLFILDEGDAIPEECYRGIEGCMTGGEVRMLIMFNPRQQIGAAYRMIRDGIANVVHLSALEHPNVVTGENIIPGAVDRRSVLTRINLWTRPLADRETPDMECFKVPDFLVGKSIDGFPDLPPGYRKIIQPEFSYMVLGQYPSQATTQLISREWVDRARKRWDGYVREYGERSPWYGVAGVDVAEYGMDANVMCCRYGGYVEKLISWQGMDQISSADRIAEELQVRNIRSVNVDAIGWGSGIAPYLQRQGINASGVKVSCNRHYRIDQAECGNLRDELWWRLREWLRTDPDAMLPPDEILLEDILAPNYEIKNGKLKVTDKPTLREMLQRSPDRGDALCLTFYETVGGERLSRLGED